MGGREFDAKFYDYFMNELEKEERGVKERAKKDERLLYDLISFLKKTKHSLCGGINDFLCEVDKLSHIGSDPITLNYDDYEKTLGDLVETLRTLVQLTVENRPITKWCFCGSSSRVPAVLKMYKQFATRGGLFSEMVQTDETVARGLCYWGFLHATDLSRSTAIPVVLNQRVVVDGRSMDARWEMFDMTVEAKKLKEEGDKEWKEVQSETERRKGLTNKYMSSVKECKQLFEE